MRALKAFVKIIFTISLIIIPAFLPASAAPVQGEHQSVGLVLSGGGAKGIAHIGVIKALEENNIPIDYVAGTSMGAIVGGLYAAGYTTDEMMQLILSPEFANWSTGRVNPRLSYYFTREKPTPQMFRFPVERRDSAMRARQPISSLIPPMPMKFGFMELFSAYTAQCGGDFDKLMVPFRCVASDVRDHRKEVMRGGDFGAAIRASMSFPIVFQPAVVDGKLLYDGGIYDNFPVDVMRSEFAPSVMIGVDVSTPSDAPPTSMMDQLDMLVVQASNHELPADEGVRIHIDLRRFSLLDFPKAAEIEAIGYKRAMDMMDSIKTVVTARTNAETLKIRRNVFKAKTPYTRFDRVNVTGGSAAQDEYLTYLFHPDSNADTIGISRVREAYYRAIGTGRIADMNPQASFNDTTGLFTLDVAASVKSRFAAGIGAYITSSNNSYVYLRGSYSTFSFRSVSAAIEAWIGQSYMAGMLSGTVNLHTGVPSAFILEAVASRRRYHESDRLFFRDHEPTFVIDHDYFAKLKWAVAAGATGAVDISVGFGHLNNSFYESISPQSYSDGRSRVIHNLGRAAVQYTSSTLDAVNFPTAGWKVVTSVGGVTGKSRYFPYSTSTAEVDRNESWLQFDFKGSRYLNFGRHWALGFEGQAVVSNRKLLDNYYAAIVSAPVYAPTPSSDNSFNPEFRANSFLAAGLTPVYKLNDNFSLRITGHVFAPMRRILEVPDGSRSARYGRWFNSTRFFGEFDAVYTLPFASICAYCNYASAAAGHKFNFGVSFGLYLPAPSFF